MQEQYSEYLEKTLSKNYTDIPNLDRIKQFVRGGADLKGYYVYDKYGYSR